MTLTDKEKIEEIREILLGLRWYGSEYRYKKEWRTGRWDYSNGVEKDPQYDSDDWERDYIDDMIEEIKDIVKS